MKSILKLLLLAFSIFSSLSSAQEDQCKGLPGYIKENLVADIQPCQCGKRLLNLKVTPPDGTKVVAACDLRWFRENGEIDLSKTSVTLDQYTDDDLPHGDIFLSGEVELSGRVTVEETLGSNIIVFVPQWNFADKKTPFSQEMSSFKFSSDEYATDFRLEDKLMGSECFVADAKIRVKGFSILISDADNAGTWPLTVKVLHISPYKPCSNK